MLLGWSPPGRKVTLGRGGDHWLPPQPCGDTLSLSALLGASRLAAAKELLLLWQLQDKAMQGHIRYLALWSRWLSPTRIPRSAL